MLLKRDQWRRESGRVQSTIGVRGTINFRNIPSTNIYCLGMVAPHPLSGELFLTFGKKLGQPTTDAVDQVLERIREAYPSADRICWINLRLVANDLPR